MAVCDVCFHHCNIKEGGLGLCMARRCVDGQIVCDNYGHVTGFALDPIEKKPLYHFHPGSRILSVGSYGCNLRCPFCQNHTISYDLNADSAKEESGFVSPEQLADIAISYVKEGNIGVAFTYNEPLIGYEYVRDSAKLIQQSGLQTVLVSNGTAELPVIEELIPLTDAINIDLKAFTDHFYSDFIGGSRAMVMDTIEACAGRCHVEVTTLIIPGENDTAEEMEALSSYLAEVGRKKGVDIPLHITRFFPRFRLTDRDATDIGNLYALVDTARQHLKYVHAGNV